ncbi:hypothetical protein FAZ19_07030 [Sphingobacterium alkalisoli]|uniref:Uncharacterized protein n=2 Tax=Sphingobacterium alkalisoli TaxID=1874115 RepID=A0A4U0H602_9SPHI|nr:hypothetical protein [Sphingobacterium alkalisoli]TJY66664.1 hypothetical protein FAZ19_07030 [Sphingobacterium alkalisoli]
MILDSFVLFWSMLILAFLLIIIGFIYLSYWLPKRFGYKRTGLWLAVTLTAFFISTIIYFIYEDEFFSKNDAKKKLNEHQIELRNDFTIISNSSGGIRDYMHQFTLGISDEDKNLIIEKITNADNFQPGLEDKYVLSSRVDRYSEVDTFFTANYKTANGFVHEHFRPHNIGTAPDFTVITILERDNKLIYEYIID